MTADRIFALRVSALLAAWLIYAAGRAAGVRQARDAFAVGFLQGIGARAGGQGDS